MSQYNGPNKNMKITVAGTTYVHD